jgi:hypothetical protein
LDVADRGRIAPVNADSQIHITVRAERHDRLSRLRIELLKQAIHGEHQSLIAAVAALPIIHSAARHAIHVFADPQFLTGLRIDSDKRSISSTPVDHTANHNGAKARVPVGVVPRNLQLAHVRLFDLFRREVPRIVRTIAISWPPLSIGGLRQARGYRGSEGREERGSHGIPLKTPPTLGHNRTPLQ